MQKQKIFFFAEDPGAVNYLLPLAKEMSNAWDIAFTAAGFARKILQDRSVAFADVDKNPSAALKYFSEARPNILLVGTAENKQSIGLQLIAEAKKNKIPAIGAVDAQMNARYRFSGPTENPLEFAPNFILLPDDIAAAEFEKIGFAKESLVTIGHPHFDFVLEQGAEIRKKSRTSLRAELFPGAKPDAFIMVYLAEGSARLNSYVDLPWEKYSLRPQYFSEARKIQGRTELSLAALIETKNSAKLKLDPDLFTVLRIHPKDEKSDYSIFSQEISQISQGGSALPLLMAADLVVGATTILLLEAAVLGLPTISIVPQRDEGNWLASVRAGITPCVSTMEALPAELAKVKKLNSYPNPQLHIVPSNVARAVDVFCQRLLDSK